MTAELPKLAKLALVAVLHAAPNAENRHANA
jgi:hypothetical protein